MGGAMERFNIKPGNNVGLFLEHGTIYFLLLN